MGELVPSYPHQSNANQSGKLYYIFSMGTRMISTLQGMGELVPSTIMLRKLQHQNEFQARLGTTLFSWFEAGHKISIISTLQEWANWCPATPTHPMLTNLYPSITMSSRHL